MQQGGKASHGGHKESGTETTSDEVAKGDRNPDGTLPIPRPYKKITANGAILRHLHERLRRRQGCRSRRRHALPRQ